jgi:hypothetical protein
MITSNFVDLIPQRFISLNSTSKEPSGSAIFFSSSYQPGIKHGSQQHISSGSELAIKMCGVDFGRFHLF